MDLVKSKTKFEQDFMSVDSVLLTFKGVDGYDVYNCSQPFNWEGQTYMFGRIEHREECMRSWARLFTKTGPDEWTVVDNSMIYQLEDPYISIVDDNLILGGTSVQVQKRELDKFFGYFYKGTDINNLYYFTTGPAMMKDIRVVQLADGRVGVFSRPRGEDTMAEYGSESMIGFTIIDDIEDLSAETIEHADYLHGLFGPGEWGACNQAYLLPDGKLGVLGHVAYEDADRGQSVYMNMAFVLDPLTREITDYHLIGTRASYPDAPAKKLNLQDCTFSCGLVPRADGLVDLYGGVGDTHEGRVAIPYPFGNHGMYVMDAYKIN